MSPNNVQLGVGNPITAVVSATVGTWAPEGTIAVRNANGNIVSSGTLALVPGSQTSQVTMSWTPDGGGNYPLFVTFTPTDGVSGSSVAPESSPFVNSVVTAVALRFPPALYVGELTLLGAVLGTGFPAGSVAFSMNGVGITGSTGIAAQGSASTQWTPSTGGVVNMGVSYSAESAGPGALVVVPAPNQSTCCPLAQTMRSLLGHQAWESGMKDRQKFSSLVQTPL
jgi:hypothetical protein